MVTASNEKHRHHVIPKHYLKGFARPDNAHQVFLYHRGVRFSPGGHGHERKNPRSRPIDDVSVVEDFYSLPAEDGALDSSTYEDGLAKIEEEGAAILRIIRAGERISIPQKAAFTKYLIMMNLRTHKRMRNLPLLLESNIAKFEAESDPRLHPMIRSLAPEVEAEYRLKSLLGDMPRCRQALYAMNWQFLTAPNDVAFVTSDAPMYLNGLRKRNDIALFPISSRYCLKVTHETNNNLGYAKAAAALVREINLFVCRHCLEEVYAPMDDRELLEFLDLAPL